MPIKRVRGIGTIIRDVTEAWKIKGYSSCAACKNLARELDNAGLSNVETNWNYWLIRLNDSIKEWRNERSFPIPQPPMFIVEQLLLYAVQTHRSELNLS